MKRWREELPPNLDSDCLEIAPENLLETISDDHYDPVRQAAKRRRIEKIATEYLKGKVPFIASAKLRGPFDKGWRNPWTSEEKAAPVQTAGYNQDGIRTRSQIGERLSPENSRGIDSEPFSPEPEDLALSAVQTAKAARSARRPSREDIQASAEKCDEVVRDPIAQPKSKRKKHTTKTPGPNLVASPALNASTGFMYRRVGEVASKAKSAKNSKPQAMAFDSSPAMLNTPKTGDAAPQVSQQELTLVGGGRARRDIYEVPEESSDGIEPQQSFRSGQQSNLSTQAAILRAHQDFQESTIPSATVETPRASLPSPDDTPQPDRSEPSVAFTAFSAFNAQLDKQHPPDSVIQDLQPVNTQDLFAAVSPFSFSTVKKKPSKSLGSSLRFAVFPSSGHNGHTEADIGVGHPTYSNRVPLKDSNARSPTPSDRMPLGDSNATLSFLGMASEKGSQESGELSFIQMTRQEVELPQLDFGNSLGNFEPNGDLNLTDRFLQQLHELR
ncbi:hypothetical protein CC80DRAFT_481032 [Byssothecium circinans]|uniref:Uncharacterized protein n=1 Tax=Byssothecium circinans TaxID=147558 RepID=A0A6A5TGG6_9PLEO|nr:hypothetical protein CC80DRAFT_481032 [Byssothecium circinans]